MCRAEKKIEQKGERHWAEESARCSPDELYKSLAGVAREACREVFPKQRVDSKYDELREERRGVEC